MIKFKEFMNEQNKTNTPKSFKSFLRESGPKEYDLDKIIAEDEIIREMAVAGYGDWDFDKRVWSYDFDKKYIRLILKEMK